MTCVMSDIHGGYGKYIEMLEKIKIPQYMSGWCEGAAKSQSVGRKFETLQEGITKAEKGLC